MSICILEAEIVLGCFVEIGGPPKRGVLGGRFGYFIFFLLFRGQGKGGRVRGEKAGYFYLEIERGGGSKEGRRGGAHPALGRCCAEEGGGYFFFIRGRNVY